MHASFIVVVCLLALLLLLWGGCSAGSISTSCGSFSPSSSLMGIAAVAAPWSGGVSAAAVAVWGGLVGLAPGGVPLLGCSSLLLFDLEVDGRRELLRGWLGVPFCLGYLWFGRRPGALQ